MSAASFCAMVFNSGIGMCQWASAVWCECHKGHSYDVVVVVYTNQ